MKKFTLLFSLVALSFLVSNTFAAQSDSQIVLEENRDGLGLVGELIVISPRSLSLVKPVTIFVNEDNVEINFNSTLGSVEIAVTDSNGNTVYSKNVNAAARTTIDISLIGWLSDTYTLTITNSKGRKTTGVFEL
ncbi:DUF3244 domain-containing protein [Dysgonomonas sp. 520]|uniref:DUF3244 domain-containing protein n=1 Tax=Dysgonomonas sp. 520 TaxID=2302931 RepID=UPI0013D70445|nr:DUF3244 domain-containing protein [Dysgonomonas sp. 520]NDW09508.1 DUF3244 domain-containing protein [Dysgonomonas sp. 520]